MKKTALVAMVIFLGLILSASVVIAGNMYNPKIMYRIVAQHKRINRGIASGYLTRAEARTLRGHLNRVKTGVSMCMADGYITKKERVRLHRLLNRNSKMIYCKKNNPVRRFY